MRELRFTGLRLKYYLYLFGGAFFSVSATGLVKMGLLSLHAIVIGPMLIVVGFLFAYLAFDILFDAWRLRRELRTLRLIMQQDMHGPTSAFVRRANIFADRK